MKPPEKCADCPLQELLANRVAHNEQQLALAQTVLDNLQTELEYEQINTALRLVLVDVTEKTILPPSENPAELKAAFERSLATLEEAAGMAIRHTQEQIIWVRHEVDTLCIHRQRMTASCVGPRQVVVPGFYYADGLPRLEPRCTSSVEDIMNTLMR